MDYENPRIPEGINVGETRPLREFLRLVVVALLLVIAAVTALALGAEHLARRIPFSFERRLVAAYERGLPAPGDIAAAPARERYVRELAARVLSASALPDDMRVQVHYLDTDTVNAFATLGGNIFIHRGLLEAMPSENALAMVIAHEVAHVQHRDPIMALGRGLTVMTALASVTGFSGNDIIGNVLGQAGLLTVLSFNRRQERAADAAALATLTRLYGHVQGAEGLFEALARAGRAEPPAILSTHPVNAERIARVRAVARAAGTRGTLTPLPAFPD